LGVDHENIKKVVEKKTIFKHKWVFFWVNTKIRKRLGHALSEPMMQCIVVFWNFETTISPNEKEIT
jgi:hypothetical protein